MSDAPIPSWRFGSPDSLDDDRVYLFAKVPSLEECQAFCKQSHENRNIIAVEDGVVSDCYKGVPDEMNNALWATCQHHPQEHPSPIAGPVERNVPLKVVRTTRILLSMLTSSWHRKEIKAALRSLDQNRRIEVLQSIDFGGLEIDVERAKSMAFQLGQALALLDGVECYTKADIAAHCPELAPLLAREDGADRGVLNGLRDRFVAALSEVYIRCDGSLNLFCYISSVKVRQWSPYNMQSRGTIIDLKSERCVAFPYAKFFKWGEVPGWQEADLRQEPLLEVVEKMDGSFVTAFRHEGELRFACKGSFDAEQALKAQQIGRSYALEALDFDRYHFSFEVLYPENRFPDGFAIVDYGPREWLCMTGARERHSHRLLDYHELSALAAAAGIPVPEAHDLSLEQLLEQAAQPGWHNFEGWVANFGGKRVKIKTAGYHQINDVANQLKHGSHRLLRTYVKADAAGWAEVLAWLPESFREAIEQELGLFEQRYQLWEERCQQYLEGHREEGQFKALVQRVQGELHSRFQRTVLRMARGLDAQQYLAEAVLSMLLEEGKRGQELEWSLYAQEPGSADL